MAAKYRVSVLPTVRLIVSGDHLEYRGDRTASSLVNFAGEALEQHANGAASKVGAQPVVEDPEGTPERVSDSCGQAESTPADSGAGETNAAAPKIESKIGASKLSRSAVQPGGQQQQQQV